MTLFPFTFAFGMPGAPELLIIGAIILLLFGHRLPKMMRSLGQGITEFKKGVNDINDDIEETPKAHVEEKPEVKTEEKAKADS